MAGRRQLILIDPLDAHLPGGDRGVVTHRQTGARLAVGGNLHTDGRRQPADEPEPVKFGFRPAHRQQCATQVVPQADRSIGGGVHAAGRGHFVTARRDPVGRCDRSLQTRPAGLLDIEGGRVRRTAGCPAHTRA